MLHSPQRLRSRSAAILLCNPFGEEAARAHRTFRVLATQLERAGYAVMRFDYGGTGDSTGESDDVSIAGWIADIGAAAEHLQTASGAKKLVAIGLRLGATLAALATSRGELRLRHLVMWDPIVEGRAYLRDLVAAHRAYMRSEMSVHWEDRLEVSPDGIPNEALGSPIRPAFAAELGAIDLLAEELRAEHVTVIRTRASDGLARLHEHLANAPAAKWIDMLDSATWDSDAALNAAVVPMDIVQAVLARTEALSP
jgi:pimeloyl-ACP methyl ester carboxylesterase